VNLPGQRKGYTCQ